MANEESSRYVHPKTLRGPFCESADVADTTYIDGRVAQKDNCGFKAFA